MSDQLDICAGTDLWTYLCNQQKKIVMYGMGNGADKILAVCEKYGIIISDFFASDNFVRGHLFHGKPVLSYSAVCDKYGKGNFIVLLSFASSLEDVISNIKRIADETELYAPDVPVAGEGLFDLEFFKQNREKFDRVFRMLADDESKRIFRNVILYKLTGKINYLFDSESDEDTVYRELLRAEGYKIYADVGAYNGDTVRKLLEYSADLTDVIALEPDQRNFKKLSAYAEAELRTKVRAYNLAAWSERAELFSDNSGNRNSNVSTNSTNSTKNCGKLIQADSLDNIFLDLDVGDPDYIKYDVEGSEKEAIDGSAGIIRRSAPDLLVSLYHRNEDMFALPLRIHRICPEYRFYIRRFRYIPAWDLNLYCIKQ